MSKAKLYFDGGKKNNDITYGYVIYNELNEIIYKNAGHINHHVFSSNTAEYIALICGMVESLRLGITELEVYGDSQLVIYQMIGKYAAKADNMIYYKTIAKELNKMFVSISYNWIPREENTDADRAGRQ